MWDSTLSTETDILKPLLIHDLFDFSRPLAVNLRTDKFTFFVNNIIISKKLTIKNDFQLSGTINKIPRVSRDIQPLTIIS